jgi:hypothetical protein
VEIKLVRTYRRERCGGGQRAEIGRRRDGHGGEASGCASGADIGGHGVILLGVSIEEAGELGRWRLG